MQGLDNNYSSKCSVRQSYLGIVRRKCRPTGQELPEELKK